MPIAVTPRRPRPARWVASAAVVSGSLLSSCHAETTRRVELPTLADATRGGCPGAPGDPLLAALCELPFAPEGGVYSPLDDRRRARVRELVGAWLRLARSTEGGEIPAALVEASRGVGFTVSSASGALGTVAVLLAREPGPLGAVVIRLGEADEVSVELPHVGFEDDTLEDGASLFRRGGRMLVVAGAHRCASAAPARCRRSGNAGHVCDGTYRASDPSADDRTALQAAHAAFVETTPSGVTASLHGFSSEVHQDLALDAMVSDGTRRIGESRSARLAQSLTRRGVRAASCNAESGGSLPLCGTTNPQGRLSNGASACGDEPGEPSGRFLHVELREGLPPAIREAAVDAVGVSLGLP